DTVMRYSSGNRPRKDGMRHQLLTVYNIRQRLCLVISKMVRRRGNGASCGRKETSVTKPATRLKSILARREAVLMPGAPNALFANVIQELGYECAYITGAGVTNMYLGVPDVGLITMSEMAQHIAVIADTVNIPLLVDGDTGFGNP